MLYAEGCFDTHRHDYRRKEPTGKMDATVLTFMDDRIGMFYRTKSGYVLEIHGKG